MAAESGGHQTETRTLSPAETAAQHGDGDGRLHEPRAGARPAARPAHRHLGVRLRAVRDAGRPAGVRAEHVVRHDRRGAHRRDRLERAAGEPAAGDAPARWADAWSARTKARLRDIADARPYLDEAAAPAPPGSGAGAPVQAVRTRAGVSRRALLASSAAVGGLLGAGLGGAVAARRRDPVALPSYQRLTFRRGMIRTARFGPDFQTVLYGALWDGDVCRVYTVRPESPESSSIALPPATPLAVSSTGELALALGTHLRGIMTYGTLARVPMAGGAPRELQEQVKYADWIADGRDLAIVRSPGDRDVLEFPAGKAIAEAGRAGRASAFRASRRAAMPWRCSSSRSPELAVGQGGRSSIGRAPGGRCRLATSTCSGWPGTATRCGSPRPTNCRCFATPCTPWTLPARCESWRACPATPACTTSRPTAACSSRAPTIAAASRCGCPARRPNAICRGSMPPTWPTCRPTAAACCSTSGRRRRPEGLGVSARHRRVPGGTARRWPGAGAVARWPLGDRAAPPRRIST